MQIQNSVIRNNYFLEINGVQPEVKKPANTQESVANQIAKHDALMENAAINAVAQDVGLVLGVAAGEVPGFAGGARNAGAQTGGVPQTKDDVRAATRQKVHDMILHEHNSRTGLVPSPTNDYAAADTAIVPGAVTSAPTAVTSKPIDKPSAISSKLSSSKPSAPAPSTGGSGTIKFQ